MPAQPNQSLADGIALLGLLCSRDQSLGSRELARQMGWEPTRANRLLGTLRDLGLARQDADRRYRAGPAVHLLAAQCLRGSGLLAAAMPALAALRRPTIGVALGVLWRGEVCYLLHAAPGRSLEDGLDGHALFPAAESSIGMALEAASPDLAASTSAAELARIRRRGWAIRRDPGTSRGSVAAAIPRASPQAPVIAGLAAIADFQLHPAEELGELVLAAARAVIVT